MFDVKLSFLSPVAEVIYPIAAQYAFAAISNAASKGVKISNIGVTERTLIHTARNQLAKGFLDSGDEWAFWWDCDVVMEPDTITRRRFDNAGRLTLWEEISLILRNPSLVKAIFKGESVNV